jgi:hypothetical protein
MGVNKDATALGRMHGRKPAPFDSYVRDRLWLQRGPRLVSSCSRRRCTRDPFEIAKEDAKPMIASVRTWVDGRFPAAGFRPLVGRLQSIAPHWSRFLFNREILPCGHTFVLLPVATGRRHLETILLPREAVLKRNRDRLWLRDQTTRCGHVVGTNRQRDSLIPPGGSGRGVALQPFSRKKTGRNAEARRFRRPLGCRSGSMDDVGVPVLPLRRFFLCPKRKRPQRGEH